jgi:mannitol/fructose-specific phosphotransferase system IIA component (Ntr-type)
MKKQLEILKKIQELALTRTECMARKDVANAESLAQEIAALVDTLEPRMRAIYDRISATKPLFMAALHNGNCSGCGMQVPAASVRLVNQTEHPVTCTTCGRLLYKNPDAIKSVRQGEDANSDEVSKIKGLARFSSAALMVPALKAKTPQEAIGELAALMVANGYVSNGEELVRLALEREALLSTRMDDGTAVPHVRGVEGGSLAFALGISRKGIVWDDSGEKVNFVVLSAIPSAGSAFFLKLMSDLMGAFRRKASREAILAATDPETLWQSLDRATRRAIG